MLSLYLLERKKEMSEQKSFKMRVKEEAIRCSKIYKGLLVDYDYLLCSEVFANANYYIIQGHEDNYEHLTGVGTKMSAAEFFEKCYDGTLEEDDFSFQKRHESEKNVKGAVRDKIRVLPDIAGLFNSNTVVEEGFHQNSIACSFAAEGITFTMGFICDGLSKPKTLLRGKKLNPKRTGALELVLRRKRGEDKFDEILVGNEDILKKFGNKVRTQLSDALLRVVNPAPAAENKDAEVEQAKFELLAEMVKEKQIEIEVAASKVQISVEEFSLRMNKIQNHE